MKYRSKGKFTPQVNFYDFSCVKDSINQLYVLGFVSYSNMTIPMVNIQNLFCSYLKTTMNISISIWKGKIVHDNSDFYGLFHQLLFNAMQKYLDRLYILLSNDVYTMRKRIIFERIESEIDTKQQFLCKGQDVFECAQIFKLKKCNC